MLGYSQNAEIHRDYSNWRLNSFFEFVIENNKEVNGGEEKDGVDNGMY